MGTRCGHRRRHPVAASRYWSSRRRQYRLRACALELIEIRWGHDGRSDHCGIVLLSFLDDYLDFVESGGAVIRACLSANEVEIGMPLNE